MGQELGGEPMSLAELGDDRRFAAFISYAHADAAVAARLQRRLESYRLPKHLANARAAQDAATDRLGAIFRDRADLAAAVDLSEAIRAALARSNALVVICSPEAKSSQWVDAEIRLFRQLHPEAPVLAAITRGDPVDALPVALTLDHREPLAADLRKRQDGARLGFLKIVAALAGVPLDALIQRDAQRRLHRVIAVTLIAAIALIAMAAMTIIAIQSRNEAQHQRAEAEGLVEYMLTDLRDELIGVGRIDVRTGVYDRAMRYYREQGPVAELPEDSLERRARVLLAMGQDEANSGKPEAAQRRYAEAYRTTAALLAQSPANPDRLFVHAQSVFYLGDIQRQLGNQPEARHRAVQYRDMALRLQSLDPDRVRALREVAYGEGGLCMFDGQATATVARAIPRCRAALSAMQQVQRLRPDDADVNDDVGNRHAWLAEALARAGNYGEALEHQAQATAMARQLLASEPDNYDRREVLAGHLLTLSKTYWRAGDRLLAEKSLGQADAMIAEMRAHDSSNQRWLTLSNDIRRQGQQMGE